MNTAAQQSSTSVGEERPAVATGRIPGAAADVTRRAVRIWTTALVVLCLGTLLLLFRHIDRTLPYPQHTDEGFISGPASNVLVNGELHPQRFNYPSLPTYYAAATMAAGFLSGASHLEIRDVKQIGEVGYPHYQTPRVMGTARKAFALLSVLCLAMTGLSAWLVFRRPAAILVAPLLVLLSPLYFRHSWLYLNVDIVATAFVSMTFAACALGFRRPSMLQSAIVPGLLAGLATASKYTQAVAILPVFATIVLTPLRRQAVVASAAALAAMVVAFLAAVPYSLIDIPAFLNGVGYEVFHYASGHAGFAGEPGIPQLVYYLKHFAAEFGYPIGVLALFGIGRFLYDDWRTAIVALILPAALLWLLTTQRVHFTRNALAIQPFVAMFATYGLLVVHDWLAGLVDRRGFTVRRVNLRAALAVILFLAVAPFWRYADHLRDRIDSRNVAREWVAENLPYDWAIVVPKELGFDRRGLEIRSRHIKVVDLSAARAAAAVQAILSDVPAPAAIMVPRWGADRRSPGQRTADVLNELTRGWRVLATFGANDVLVNYSSATAWGNPAFSIAVLK